MSLFKAFKKNSVKVENGVQKATITVDKGYQPDRLNLEKGMPVELTFHRLNPSGCLSEIVLKDFNIHDELPLNEDHIVRFTPNESGEYGFACGMDMFHGKLTVK